jgi:hypothetical protein
MLEIVDLRLFKVREYQGRKHASEFAYSLNFEIWRLEDIENHLNWLNHFEINNERFKEYLKIGDYSGQSGLLRALFIDYSERLQKKPYTLDQLRSRMASNPTIEHILSQTPNFEPQAIGFKNEQDFEEHKNLLGNLTLLEKKRNSSLQNANVIEKAPVYKASKFRITSVLGTELTVNSSFTKKLLIARTKDLADKFSQWWPE